MLMPRPISKSYDVVVAINYYYPHISGLTRTAQVVAEACVRSELSVKVVCIRHDERSPRHEVVNGVVVERVPVIGHIENGLLSPGFPLRVARSAKRAGVLHLHLPMAEGALIAALTRGIPRIVSYQCDATSSNRFIRPIIHSLVDASTRMTIRGASQTIVSSLDYAEASRVSTALRGATEIFPVVLDQRGGKPIFRQGSGPRYGYLGRLAPEKGLPELIQAFKKADIKESVLIIAGPTPPLADRRVTELVSHESATNPQVQYLGALDESELKNFYASIDYFVLPSTNGLEAFGIAQAEALICGLPVIATNLPGVKTLLQRFGDGILVPPGDVAALAKALSAIQSVPKGSNVAQPLLTGTGQYLQLIRDVLRSSALSN